MKKKLSLLLIVITAGTFSSINAQSFKEKLKAKMDALDKKFIEKVNAGSYKPNFTKETPQEVAAKSWEEGSYNYYQKNNGKWVKTNKTNVKLLKNDAGAITSVKLGGGEYKLQGLDEGYGKYYFYKTYGLGLIMDSSIMVIFNTFSYSVVASVNKHISNVDEETQNKIKAYVKNAEEILTNKRKEVAKKNEAERKAKFGLKGKDVKSIEIVNFTAGKNGKIGCYSYVSYAIVATLKDGTKISTAKGGYESDYEIKVAGSKIVAGKIKAAFFDKDVISIDVKVKSNPKITTHKELVIPYNQAISFNWNGIGWSSSRGESARNIRIEIKQTTHTETGKDLLKVRIKKVDGSLLSEFKISPDMNIIVLLKGGNGGTNNGAVYPGGNGGNITVIKDPNVKYYSLDSYQNGGNGGRNEYGKTGYSGKSGVIKVETRPLNF